MGATVGTWIDGRESGGVVARAVRNAAVRLFAEREVGRDDGWVCEAYASPLGFPGVHGAGHNHPNILETKQTHVALISAHGT